MGNSGDMWNNGNSFGNKVPLFLAARNTVIVQNHAACINEQFSKITDDGYLRMIEMKVPSNATAPASGQRDYGTAAFYGCGTGFSVEVQQSVDIRRLQNGNPCPSSWAENGFIWVSGWFLMNLPVRNLIRK